jgi:hypothetical protein
VRQRQIGGAVGGPDAGTVAVEAKHRLRRHFPEQFELVFGERRAERRHGILDAGLMKSDDVHISLDGNDRRFAVQALGGTPGAREIIKHVALVKEFGLVRVQVFRRRIGRHGAAAEGNHLFAGREDGKHDAIAETVVGNRDIGPVHHEPARFDLLFGDAFSGKKFLQRIATVRGEAQPERLDRAAGQSAVAQIGARPRPVRCL